MHKSQLCTYVCGLKRLYLSNNYGVISMAHFVSFCLPAALVCSWKGFCGKVIVLKRGWSDRNVWKAYSWWVWWSVWSLVGGCDKWVESIFFKAY